MVDGGDAVKEGNRVDTRDRTLTSRATVSHDAPANAKIRQID
jgi:hypothetical protein